LPFLVLFPQYFGGKIEYGDMVQANFAFTQVYTALSLIVSQIEQITNFAAGVERLSTFADVLKPEHTPAPGIKSEEADRFALNHITLLTPNRMRTLIQDLTVDLERRDNLVVVGQSGVGKSSLLRASRGKGS
jgi:putative ATP-binding cassette transporter